MPVTCVSTVWTISNMSYRLAMSMRTVRGCVLFISRGRGWRPLGNEGERRSKATVACAGGGRQAAVKAGLAQIVIRCDTRVRRSKRSVSLDRVRAGSPRPDPLDEGKREAESDAFR